MKILFTGGSSFTGFWFIRELALDGHQVTAIFQKPLESYDGLRKVRIDLLKPHCKMVFGTYFGSEPFLDLIEREDRWDLFCHHAADVTDYKSPNFDVVKAVSNNTRNLTSVLEKLKSKHCSSILLTGSIFEQNEGKGTEPLKPFSPYGLSKGITSEIFKYYALQQGFSLGKFVIPNPFGPYEEFKFTSYLMKTWKEQKIAVVGTPVYIRDNIHISLLAKAYLYFAKHLKKQQGFIRFNPSGYRETQAKFTSRFSNEMKKRLNLPCEFTLADQTVFQEPIERVNFDSLDHLYWNEDKAWDLLADYYKQEFR